jgi:hypothetical protein
LAAKQQTVTGEPGYADFIRDVFVEARQIETVDMAMSLIPGSLPSRPNEK